MSLRWPSRPRRTPCPRRLSVAQRASSNTTVVDPSRATGPLTPKDEEPKSVSTRDEELKLKPFSCPLRTCVHCAERSQVFSTEQLKRSSWTSVLLQDFSLPVNESDEVFADVVESLGWCLHYVMCVWQTFVSLMNSNLSRWPLQMVNSYLTQSTTTNSGHLSTFIFSLSSESCSPLTSTLHTHTDQRGQRCKGESSLLPIPIGLSSLWRRGPLDDWTKAFKRPSACLSRAQRRRCCCSTQQSPSSGGGLQQHMKLFIDTFI